MEEAGQKLVLSVGHKAAPKKLNKILGVETSAMFHLKMDDGGSPVQNGGGNIGEKEIIIKAIEILGNEIAMRLIKKAKKVFGDKKKGKK